jgi:DNA-binding beta-propeller fold protein YncE
MKKYACLMCVVFALVGVANAQTTNPGYEVATFGAPPGGGAWGDTISVAADGAGSILVLRREDPPVLVFNREGELQDSWGDGLFPNNHSIDVDHEGNVWITDRTNSMVHKFTLDGQALLSLGTKGVTGDRDSTDAFAGPADVAIAPNGDIYVLDGNARIVHFSKDGSFIKTIGGVDGTGPGQFEGAHALALDGAGRLLVVDRQEGAGNPRIQVFDQYGRFVQEWTRLAGLAHPSGITIGGDGTVYISESDDANLTLVRDGKVVEWIAGLEARAHNIVWDAGTGDLYLADSDVPGDVKKIVKK